MFKKILSLVFGSGEAGKPAPEGSPDAAGATAAQATEVHFRDPTLAQIVLFALDYAPMGWQLCDGRHLPINQHMALFALLGTQHGGDGRETFGLPDLRGKEPIPHTTYCICVDGVFPSRHH